MNRKLFAIGSACAALLAAGACATTSSSQPAGPQPSAEITYEDIDAGPQAADAGAQAAAPGGVTAATTPTEPFDGCVVKQAQKGVATLDCGTTDAVLANVVGQMPPDQVQQNFDAYAKSFPADAKKERVTREVGGKTAQGLRITGSGFAASMLIVPHSAKHTWVVACRVQSGTDFTRCGQILDQLASAGVPAQLPGADQLPKSMVANKASDPRSTGPDGGMPMATDGGR